MTEQYQAGHYQVLDQGKVRCGLCPQGCVIAPGALGLCRSRTNEDGRLMLTNYGRYTSLALDPIEKKPLYHFHPGRNILSIGGLGCNFQCAFCQNWNIAHGDVSVQFTTPEELAEHARVCGRRNTGVAFTYNEPMIWFEFIRDTAPLLRERGLAVVLVTNGFINPEPFAELAPLVDAMNVDLKSFDDGFYRKYCKGRVAPVKETIAAAVKAGVWVEATQLLVPGLNDSAEQVRDSAAWLASVSRDIPLHLSRYFPNYKMKRAPTGADVMLRAFDTASEYLDFVYLGNMGSPDHGRTLCRGCGAAVIERAGYVVSTEGLGPGMTCAACGAAVPGVAAD